VTESDLELVARVLALGDGGAFAELVRRHQSGVRHLLRRLTGGNAALADDLAQDTFLKAYRGLATYRGGKFGAWLYRIAYNVFASATRSAKPAPELGPAAELAPPDGLRLDLEAALVHLRPEERTAIALTLGRDVTHEEAAEILGWPLGTLKSHVSRGREKLARLLEDWRPE